MADEDFEKEDYGDAQVGMEKSAIESRINELLKTPTCDLGEECKANVVEPAEEAWLRLMSAVPTEGQTARISPARDIQSYALPNGESVNSLVASLRPSSPDDYAIDRISSEWKTVYHALNPVPEDLKNGLSTLSEDWKGEDYDAFEEQVEKVIKNVRTVLADIWGEGSEAGGAVKILDEKSGSIYGQQGGDECVYPSPKFHLEDAAACSHKIHIRPPYFGACEVFADDETKVAMEWAGFEPTIIDEVQEERQRIYDWYIETSNQYPEFEVDGMRGEQLANAKADEYAQRETDRLGTDGQEQLQAQATQVNEDITDRHENTDLMVSEITPEAKTSDPTAFNEGGDVETPGSGGLDGGSPPGGGAPPGLGDMNPPGSPSGLTPTSPNSPNLPDGNGPGDFNSPNSPNSPNLPDPNNPGLDDDPWSPSSPDPDDLGGGLASGGGLGSGSGLGGGPGLGGPGGGMGGGPGGGIGAGGGGIGGGVGGVGGMMGAGGGARGMGAGAGGGRGAGAGGGRGAGGAGRGMMGGMMGGAGGRGMGGAGEDGQETGTWLTEDDDVWGIGNEDSDPYA